MGQQSEYFTPKERIGYETFLYSGFYALYNLVFTTSISTNTVVFGVFLGGLFLRYHLVVSDEGVSESRWGQWTGSIMTIGGTAIIAYVLFQAAHQLTWIVGTPENDVVALAGAVIATTAAVGLAHYRLFRSDEQLRQTFLDNVHREGVEGLIARAGIRLDQEAERGNFDVDVDIGIRSEERRKLREMAREGEIRTEAIGDAEQFLRTNKHIFQIAATAIHAILSVLLLVSTILSSVVLGSLVSLDMLSLAVIVAGAYYLLISLEIRFGLRKKISRPLWHLPFEIIGCILVVYFSLFNTGAMGGAEILAIVPFTLYVGTPWGYKQSIRVTGWLFERNAEHPEELKQFAKNLRDEI